MTLTEKISYIRGLADGLKLDENKDEVKVLNAIMELLEDMAVSVADLEDLYDEMSDYIDEVDEDLAALEEDFYDECGCCDCDDEFDCDDCCSEDDFDTDTAYYEVTCGKCGEVICVDEDVLLEGEINCPQCGELLEFDFSDLEDCCDDDCCCDCCSDDQ
ncbi:MAG: CD1247 N-terminal domain-containing protein [Ruminococcus sp.]